MHQRFLTSLIVILVMLVTNPARAQEHSSSGEAMSASQQGSGIQAYILGANDEIEITVFGQEKLGLKTRINGDGTIMAPLLGIVTVSGKTTAQLSRELAAKYERSQILVNPSINVEVTTYASKMVTVTGEVKNAGNYPLDMPYSAAQMVAKAGGAGPGGANYVVYVTPAGSKETKHLYMIGTPGATTYILQPGDALFVPATEYVSVTGAVTNPGNVAYTPGLTFRRALGAVGGPTVAGSDRKYTVRRAGNAIKPALDEEAQPGDVLIIKEKLF